MVPHNWMPVVMTLGMVPHNWMPMVLHVTTCGLTLGMVPQVDANGDACDHLAHIAA